MIAALVLNIVAFLLQVRPLPPQPGGSGDGGVALVYIALIVITFLLIAGVIGLAIAGLLNLAEAPKWSQALAALTGVAAAVAIMWNYWDLFSRYLVVAAEWSWIGMLLIFMVVMIVMIVWAVFAGVKSAFSRENVGSTLSLIAITSGTIYLYEFGGWGFWSSLGISVLGMILIGTAILLAWDLLFPRRRDRNG